MALNSVLRGRAYKLYLRTTGEESKAGASIKAVDAATGYEEIAKALKHASPTKATRSTHERPGPGKALPASGAKVQADSREGYPKTGLMLGPR